jgi:hypothetical protein
MQKTARHADSAEHILYFCCIFKYNKRWTHLLRTHLYCIVHLDTIPFNTIIRVRLPNFIAILGKNNNKLGYSTMCTSLCVHSSESVISHHLTISRLVARGRPTPGPYCIITIRLLNNNIIDCQHFSPGHGRVLYKVSPVQAGKWPVRGFGRCYLSRPGSWIQYTWPVSVGHQVL